MAHETRAEQEAPDLDRLSAMEDGEGRNTFLTVYADLTDDDWERSVKSAVDLERRRIDKIEAESVRFHQAFDQAFVAAERLRKGGAKGALLVMAPVHDIEVVHALDRPVKTHVVLDDRPDLSQLD